MDPVRTEVTFLDDGHEGVDISGIIRAGSKTVFTADATMLIDDDDAVFPPPGGLDRTVDDTGRTLTLVAERREEVTRDVRVLSFFDNLHPGAKHSRGDAVLRFAGDGTAVAADTAPQIDHHRIPFLFCRVLFHWSLTAV
jgi:hypothetical protein